VKAGAIALVERFAAPKRQWGRACSRAGISGVRIHDIRHTYGSYGTAIVGKAAVGKQLGHQRSATTDRYDHAIPEHQRIAVDRIGAALDKALRGAATDGIDHLDVQPATSN
jgi:integrase